MTARIGLAVVEKISSRYLKRFSSYAQMKVCATRYAQEVLKNVNFRVLQEHPDWQYAKLCPVIWTVCPCQIGHTGSI